jgi:small subunit ribosomal protein S1
MHHAVDVAVEAEEQAELGLVLDLAFDGGAGRMLFGEGFPRIGERLLQAKRNPALHRVDFEHGDFDFLRGRNQLAGEAPAQTEDGNDLKKGAVVTCEILEVKEAGLEVKIVGTELTTFIKRNELSRDRNEQRTDRFATGEKIDARVLLYDRRNHKVTVSVKALEIAEEKEAVAQYGSSDSGATLGDILGKALNRGKEKEE